MSQVKSISQLIVPHHIAGLVIGRNKRHLLNLKYKYEVSFWVRNVKSQKIFLSGPEKMVRKAKEFLGKVIKHAEERLAQTAAHETELQLEPVAPQEVLSDESDLKATGAEATITTAEVFIPARVFYLVLGKKKSRLQQLKIRYNVFYDMRSTQSGPPEVAIVLKGNEDKLSEAVSHLNKRISTIREGFASKGATPVDQQGTAGIMKGRSGKPLRNLSVSFADGNPKKGNNLLHSQRPSSSMHDINMNIIHEENYTERVLVRTDIANEIIGKRKQNLHIVKNEFGVSFDIDRRKHTDKSIFLTGNPINVEEASRCLQSSINFAKKVVYGSLTHEASGSSLLKKTTIEDVLVENGSSKKTAVVSPLMTKETFVPRELVPVVIGRRKSRLIHLKLYYNVSFKIKPVAGHDAYITVILRGSPVNLVKAVHHLKGVISDAMKSKGGNLNTENSTEKMDVALPSVDSGCIEAPEDEATSQILTNQGGVDSKVDQSRGSSHGIQNVQRKVDNSTQEHESNANTFDNLCGDNCGKVHAPQFTLQVAVEHKTSDHAHTKDDVPDTVMSSQSGQDASFVNTRKLSTTCVSPSAPDEKCVHSHINDAVMQPCDETSC